MVDMNATAVTARLREISVLLRDRGWQVKGVDMSSAAVEARLRVQGSLCDMCRRLVAVGSGLAPPR